MTKAMWAALVMGAACMAQTPNCSVAPGSKQDGTERNYATETLFEYMDGNSEGYFLYGFRSMKGITCSKGELKLVFDVSTFKDHESAYGMFTGNLDTREPVLKVGGGGQVTPRKAVFTKGVYYVEIAAEPEGQHTALLTDAITAFEKTLQGETTPPPQVAWFPAEGIKPGFPRLVPQSLLGLRMLRRGYLAQYESGRAFVVEEASEQAAKDLMSKLKERFQASGDLAVGTDGFTASDRYLGRLCMFRVGSRIAGWTGLAEGADAARLAAGIAGRIK
ncbi:MAG TPA: hypothetical protein PKJ41_05080 [Bryobacteraceae bacterium]|nr:hypothetical protein [Bryobacteraceae bacterium]